MQRLRSVIASLKIGESQIVRIGRGGVSAIDLVAAVKRREIEIERRTDSEGTVRIKRIATVLWT